LTNKKKKPLISQGLLDVTGRYRTIDWGGVHTTVSPKYRDQTLFTDSFFRHTPKSTPKSKSHPGFALCLPSMLRSNNIMLGRASNVNI
jgi:hypothetical protein